MFPVWQVLTCQGQWVCRIRFSETILSRYFWHLLDKSAHLGSLWTAPSSLMPIDTAFVSYQLKSSFCRYAIRWRCPIAIFYKFVAHLFWVFFQYGPCLWTTPQSKSSFPAGLIWEHPSIKPKIYPIHFTLAFFVSSLLFRAKVRNSFLIILQFRSSFFQEWTRSATLSYPLHTKYVTAVWSPCKSVPRFLCATPQTLDYAPQDWF